MKPFYFLTGKRRWLAALGVWLLLALAVPGARAADEGARAELAILLTTDLHGQVRSFDYDRLSEDPSVGLERTATLIAAARREFANSLLLDNGDTIQGNALTDYQALVRPLPCGEVLAIFKAMNALGYDAMAVGNHEFNYGLSFLARVSGRRFDVDLRPGEPPMPERACAGPTFPLLLANVRSAKTGAPLFAPYVILERRLKATRPDGAAVELPVRIGVIGFTPPRILDWDKRWLDGVVVVDGIKETAERLVPKMRAEGADLVLVLSHGGLDGQPYRPTMENAGYHLAQVPGVDALLLGHSHQFFPDATSRVPAFDLPGVDKRLGRVHGVPAVMPGFWGKALGVVRFELALRQGRWVVEPERTEVQLRRIQQADRSFVAPDQALAAAIDAEHRATLDYVKTPIGSSDFALSSVFADVGDVSALQVVNMAQTAYVRRQLPAVAPQLARLPVLSMAAPFKTGFAGPADYIDIAAGPLAIHHAADLYVYPNTLHAVKVTGAGLKDWLEAAARRFNRIDPASTQEQWLVGNVPGFNFDVPTDPDLRYAIDVTQPVGQRIVGLEYRGAPIDPAAEFIVATNNYRAGGGGGFPGLDGTRTVLETTETNREVLIDYLRTVRRLERATHAGARSWRFAPVKTAGPVLLRAPAGKLPLAQAAGLPHVSLYREDDGSGRGLAVYRIDLAR
jgi:2',3'-cyclic-nucleotide 2'-phosphodiesterase/3'-nucleotidase